MCNSDCWLTIRNDKERYAQYLAKRRASRKRKYKEDASYREKIKREAREYYKKKKSNNVAV